MLRAMIAVLCLLPATIATGQDDMPANCLIQFHADWCNPCQRMKPLVNRLEKEGYTVVRVNVDKQKALARKYKVATIPCFVGLVDDKVVARHERTLSYDGLKRLVGRLPKAVAPGTKLRPNPK